MYSKFLLFFPIFYQLMKIDFIFDILQFIDKLNVFLLNFSDVLF